MNLAVDKFTILSIHSLLLTKLFTFQALGLAQINGTAITLNEYA